MSNVDKVRNKLINQFYDNTTMLEVAMNIEQFLSDDAMIYPYKNWYKGELISGPFIQRYSVVVILKYDYEDMPDPEGGKVLTKFGVKVYYKKSNEKMIDVEASEEKREKVYKNKKNWLIKLVIPRDLVANEDQEKMLANMEEMLDVDSLQDALDDDMKNKEGFENPDEEQK